MNEQSDNAKVECTIPILPVSNLAASVDFYTNSLGFKLDWGDIHQGTHCSVSRDGRPLMLMQQSQLVSPVWVWIGLADETLFTELQAKGVQVLQEPRNCTWAYEMKFEDIDGNTLWMGTEPRKHEPFADER